MPTEVIMPKVDMDMATGTIAAWHARDGEKVEKGAPLFDIETDKAAMEVEAPATGTLRFVSAEEGAEVAIGAPVAWIYADGEETGDAPATSGAGAAPMATAANGTGRPPVEDTLAANGGPGAGRWRATPVARRLAAREGVSLAAVEGSGPRGRIQRDDVWRHLESLRADASGEAVAGEAVAGGAHRDEAGAGAAPPVEVRAGEAATTERAARAPDAPALAPGAVLASVDSRGRIHGADLPPLVTIHGFLADAGSWEPLRRRLGLAAPTHHLELPNHGRGPRRRVASFDDLVGAMLAAFDALKTARCHLVGHSLGAAVALSLAEQRPGAVDALTLLCPAGLGPEIDGRVLSGIVAATRAESLAPWLKTLVADPEAISWNHVAAAAAARADPALREAQAAMADALFPDGTQAFDVGPALDRLRCPVRIVWGRRDRIIPWQHALRAPGRVALHLFGDIGHLPQLEAADELAALLTVRA